MIILFIVLLILLFFLLGTVSVYLTYDNQFNIIIKILGIKFFNSANLPEKKKKRIEKEAEKETKVDLGKEEKQTKNFKVLIEKILRLLKYVTSSLKRSLIVSKYELYYRFGLGDAAQTGIYSGIVYAAFYTLDSYIMNNFRLKNKNINIVPDFDNCIQEIKLNIVLKIKIYELIILIIRGLIIRFEK